MVKAVPVKTPLANKKLRKPRTNKRTEESPQSQGPATAQMSPEEWYQMVQNAAYHIAEKDGFQRGKEQEYWLEAERELKNPQEIKKPDIH